MWRGWRVLSPQTPFTRRLLCNHLGARARSAVTLPPPPPISAVVRIVAGRTALSATNASRGLSIGTTKRKGGDRDRQERWRPGGKRGARGGEAVGGRLSKGGSSGLWMKRHLKDPYVSAATESGAPSRAAYKLVEINDKHGVLAPGDRVVDLGAAPGGWSMVASRVALAPGVGHGRTAASGRSRRSSSSRRGGSGAGSGSPPSLPPPLPVDGGGGDGEEEGLGEMEAVVVAVDLLEMEPLPGVQAVRGDFRDASVQAEIFGRLAAEPLTSPGSPRSSGTNGETAPPDPSGTQTSADGAGNNRSSASSGAFLLRGTSSSEQLLPRPTEPSVDSLESLLRHGAENPSSNSKATSSGAGAGAELAAAGRNSSDAASWALGAETRSAAAEDEGGLATAFGARGRLRRANVVLSDMAPSFTGDRDTDQGRAAGLVLNALAACVGDEGARRRQRSSSNSGQRAEGFGEGRGTASARQEIERVEENAEEEEHVGGEVEGPGPGLLARGGTFLGKFFAGRDEREVKLEASRLFRKVRMVKPPASRMRSSEMYVLATGFLD